MYGVSSHTAHTALTSKVHSTGTHVEDICSNAARTAATSAALGSAAQRSTVEWIMSGTCGPGSPALAPVSYTHLTLPTIPLV